MRTLTAVIDFSARSGALGSLGVQRIGVASERHLAIVDARLDNRRELSSLLGMEPPSPANDEQLILAAYARWGESCPKHLLGDFRFAIWDVDRHQLFCACDPLSVRSLFWARRGQSLWLASEARLILAETTIPATLDDHTVADYLVGLTQDPSRTFFRDVHRLPAGHFMVVTKFGQRQESYWDLAGSRTIRYRHKEQYAEHLREILDRAVEDRSRTAAPTIASPRQA